ncbi:MAG TPA: T9SS type A sorting domain-containing protein [Bacteroidia bacterium]|nr:T9SS type A sorting domain-containing protein [Bacteroidia bacterium]
MKLYSFFITILLPTLAWAQSSSLPFTIEIEPVIAGPLPGLHSFAFAQSGSKWLFVGGRTNGLHGFSTNDNFDVQYANNDIVVIDTATWSYYTSPLTPLPLSVADPLRSTNMQYGRMGDYLYMVGGFGWDSLTNNYVTFQTVTAIHIDNMINAVMTSTSIVPHIRQIADTNFRVCGGEMTCANGECFIFFGHDFSGRYSDPPIPTFIQIYTNKIKRFTISDDGINLSIANYSSLEDTNHFHRRDLNVGPVIFPGGAQGWYAYSGVFRKDVDLPFTWPIRFDAAAGATVDSSFNQLMNNYTCPMVPLFDSVSETMYTVFFGGFSLYNYNPSSGQLTLDSLIPFVSDISVLVHDAAGLWTQVPLQLQMPGLQGGNMKFIPVSTIPAYPNEVVRLRELSGRMLAGYLVGGIVSPVANDPVQTWANDTVYRVFLTPDQNMLAFSHPLAEGTVDVFPNPATDRLTVRAHSGGKVFIQVYNAQGKRILSENHNGRQDAIFNLEGFPAGIYFVTIHTQENSIQRRFTIVK